MQFVRGLSIPKRLATDSDCICHRAANRDEIVWVHDRNGPITIMKNSVQPHEPYMSDEIALRPARSEASIAPTRN